MQQEEELTPKHTMKLRTRKSPPNPLPSLRKPSHSLPHRPRRPTLLSPPHRNLNLGLIPRAHPTPRIRPIERNIRTSRHEQTRRQSNRRPRAKVPRADNVDLDFAIAERGDDGQLADIRSAAAVEEGGFDGLREGYDGGGAVPGRGAVVSLLSSLNFFPPPLTSFTFLQYSHIVI